MPMLTTRSANPVTTRTRSALSRNRQPTPGRRSTISSWSCGRHQRPKASSRATRPSTRSARCCARCSRAGPRPIQLSSPICARSLRSSRSSSRRPTTSLPAGSPIYAAPYGAASSSCWERRTRWQFQEKADERDSPGETPHVASARPALGRVRRCCRRHSVFPARHPTHLRGLRARPERRRGLCLARRGLADVLGQLDGDLRRRTRARHAGGPRGL